MANDGPAGTVYLKMREEQERRLAETSSDAAARRVHAELAERYAAKLAQPAEAA